MKDSRKRWYSDMDVLREMLPFVWKREVAFINAENHRAVRYFSIENPYYFIDIKDNIVKFDKDNKYNMYRSVAQYTQIPNFTYNSSRRSNATKLWANTKKFKNGECFEAYDLFFDFDVKNKDRPEEFKLLKDDILEFKEYLDNWVVPYQIFFSGQKGFQIIIPYMHLPHHKLSFSIDDKDNFFQFTKKAVESIKKNFEYQFLDLNQNGVRTRLCKVPYSLSQIDCVVLPLTDLQIKNFKNPEQFHVDKITESVEIKNRGSLERFTDISLKEKIRNTKKFLYTFGGKSKW